MAIHGHINSRQVRIHGLTPLENKHAITLIMDEIVNEICALLQEIILLEFERLQKPQDSEFFPPSVITYICPILAQTSILGFQVGKLT